MINNEMNIVFSVDDNFVPQLAVTITSILRNSGVSDEFNFFVLDGGIQKIHKDQIIKLKKIKQFNIEFVQINEKDFKDCPLSHHFKLPTYFRIKLPTLLNLDKVLYLDCDIIVRKSLRPLYDIDLKTSYAAAVQDYSFERADIQNQIKVLGITNYFNAGILLLNLKKIREDNIEQKCFDFIKKTPGKILFVDQCVLNKIFKDNVIFIDKINNFQHNPEFDAILKSYEQIKNEVVILHLTSDKKPWLFNQLLPLTLEYYSYLIQTPCRNAIIKDIKRFVSKKLQIKSEPKNLCLPSLEFKTFFNKIVLLLIISGLDWIGLERFFSRKNSKSCKKFLKHKVKPNSVLIVEPTFSHGELLPALIKYFEDLGFNIDLIVNNVLDKGKPLARINKNKYKKFVVKNYDYDVALAGKNLAEYEYIFFSSYNTYNDCKFLGGNPSIYETFPQITSSKHGIYAMTHHTDILDDKIWENGKAFMLADFDIKDKKKPITVNTSYFGDIQITAKNNLTNFIMVGGIEAYRRNCNLLIDSVKKLHDLNFTNFKITIIGRGKLDDMPKEIRKYFDIKGRLDYPKMYNEMEKADFFLPLLDPENEEHDRYIKDGTSGSFQLIYGFAKPCLINKKFLNPHGFDDKNSLVYESNQDLREAMIKAIKMNNDEYSQMQTELKKLAENIYKKSLNNLKNSL